MDILEQEYVNNKETKTPKKKKILIALMISIMLFILILVIQSSIPKKTAPVKESFILNGEEKEIPENFIITDEEHVNRYIDLKKLAEFSGYNYFNGEYLKTTEDKNKCYINIDDNIVGFEKDSNIIYVTQVNSIVEYQNYKLTKPIVSYNNNLYINIDDILRALNIKTSYNSYKKQTIIETADYIIEKTQKEFDDNKINTKVDTDNNNKNTLKYDMLVVISNSKYGVIKLSNKDEVLIGNKYNSLQYDEFTGNFIISNSNDKYGVIDEKGTGVIEPKYDKLELINYDPVLYVVKLNNKYGVVDKQGKTVINIEYDGIGYNDNKGTDVNSVKIIKNFQDNKNTIVVKKDGKYGLINISNQDVIIDCDLDAVYSKLTDEGEIEYYILYEGDEISLSELINKNNTKTIIKTDD